MRPTLKNDFLTRDALLGTLLGVFFSSHALRTVFHIDFHKVLIATILIFIITFTIIMSKRLIYLKVSPLIFLTFSALVLFIILQFIDERNFSKGLEIISIFILLFLAGLIKRKDVFINYMKNICIFSVILQSFFLIMNKTHVYSFGINYLLIGALTPVVTVYLYHKAWTVQKKSLRLIFLTSSTFTLIALLQVQGRFSLLLTIFGLLLLTIYYFPKIAKSIEGVIMFTILIYFVNELYIFLQNAPAIKRTLILLQSAETFDRIIIIKTYLNALKDVWVTGFGLGQTPAFPPYYYPHNFLIEFVTEFGIIGGMFILAISTLIMRRMIIMPLDKDYCVFTIFLTVNYILFFLKSGSIYDSFALFAVFAVTLIGSQNERN